MAIRARVLARDGWTCQCEECASTGRVLVAQEVDHITPLADGGTDPGVTLVDLDLAQVDGARARVPSLTHDREFTTP